MRENRIEELSSGPESGRRRILVVGSGAGFSGEVMDYSVHLAGRLNYEIVALNVIPTAWDAKVSEQRADAAADALRKKASRNAVPFEHVVKFGSLGECVEELNQTIKRIELVITDSGVNGEEIGKEVTVPLFCVDSKTFNPQGGRDMADHQNPTNKKALAVKVAGLGALSAAIYATVFMNADTVMHYCTKGGLYASLPILTVFAVSFVHGAFASNLWSLLGIEAMKKESLRQTEQKVAEKRKVARKKPRAYAYVNPFHKI